MKNKIFGFNSVVECLENGFELPVAKEDFQKYKTIRLIELQFMVKISSNIYNLLVNFFVMNI